MAERKEGRRPEDAMAFVCCLAFSSCFSFAGFLRGSPLREAFEDAPCLCFGVQDWEVAAKTAPHGRETVG